MADTFVTTGTAQPIRVLTGMGPGSNADQQVFTLADSAGNLLGTAAAPVPVSSRVAGLTATSSTITTSVGTVTATTDIPNAGTATVIAYGTAVVGAVLNFEASPDGTNWAPVLGQRTDSYETEVTTPALTLSPGIRAWDVPLPGFTQFRVRASALTSGTVNIVILPAVNAFEIAPSVGLAATPLFEVVASAAAVNAAGFMTQDCTTYRSVAVALSGTWAGTVQFEGSNDNSSWFGVTLTNFSSAQGSPISSVTFNGLFYGAVPYRYFRLRCSAYTSGTIISTTEFSAAPPAYHAAGTQIANASGAATLADAFANPSVGHLGADLMLFNGSSWDRARANNNALTGDTGAKTVTFNGANQTNMNARGAVVVLNIGTVSGTTPTLVAKLQGSADGGTTWYDVPAATTASLTATGVYVIECYPGATPVAGTASAGSVAAVSHPLPRTWRVAYTLGGTSPSFTLTNVQVTYIV